MLPGDEVGRRFSKGGWVGLDEGDPGPFDGLNIGARSLIPMPDNCAKLSGGERGE